MKIITPLWSDPVGWSEWIAKSIPQIFIFILIHIGFVFLGFLSIANLLNDSTVGSQISMLEIASRGWSIIFIGIFYPAMYLYAIHRLLKILRVKEK